MELPDENTESPNYKNVVQARNIERPLVCLSESDMKNNKGFTLLEMLITMGLVILVIVITSVAFNAILKNASRLISSEKSNIEGVVGLEMFRHDLQQAGFGLPDSFTNYDPTIQYYTEATVDPAKSLNGAYLQPVLSHVR